MNFDTCYKNYNRCQTKVVECRRGNFFSRHILSLPWQWKRDSYRKKAIRIIENKTDFPNLPKAGDPELIISLTTYPPRIGRVHLVIKSLLMQRHLPHKICLWLSQEQFPDRKLPAELEALKAFGLEIDFVPENIRSHTKYFYAFERYPDKIVITVDDDLIYESDTVTRLWEAHRQFPKAVCTNLAAEILWDQTGYLPYNKWKTKRNKSDKPQLSLALLGFSGVLYPPMAAREGVMLDKELLRRLAPLADDLWLKGVLLSQGVEVVESAGQFVHPMVIPGSQKVRLMSENVGGNKNDLQWAELDSYFGLSDILRKEYGPTNLP